MCDNFLKSVKAKVGRFFIGTGREERSYCGRGMVVVLLALLLFFLFRLIPAIKLGPVGAPLLFQLVSLSVSIHGTFSLGRRDAMV
jgi:hypothetical protein